MFAQRASRRPNGDIYAQERVPDPERLTNAGAEVVSTREPQVAGGGTFHVSGEIPRLTSYETGLPGQLRRSDDGQFVFSACSHAGLINVLNHARAAFPEVPLYGAMGGLHLSGVNEKIIPDTVGDLEQFGLKLLAPGHCTGWRALAAMARILGDELVPSAVGKRYVV